MTEIMSHTNGAAGAGGGEGVTREGWLHAAIEAFRPRFEEIGLPLPEKIHVSVGFSYGAKAESKSVLGECWARRASADDVNQIFISPMASDPAAMLATLLHELIHAADDVAHGHKGAFAEAAVRLGLEGKMTATYAGLALAAELIVMAEALGEFPHAALNPIPRTVPVSVPPGEDAPAPEPPIKAGPGKQGTRMIKLTAGDCCGYTVRTTRKWLDEGLPQCPHGSEMTED
jgi:SprT-like family